MADELGHDMNPDDAREYTESLGQIVAGSWRQVALAQRLGVPAALGLTTPQWVDQLGGYVKLSVPDRRDAVRELADEGLSQRGIADVLGVVEGTIRNDVRNLAHGTVDSRPEDDESAQDCAPPGRRLEAVYSSGSDEWATPPELFALLHKEFRFRLDVCATADNAKCSRFYTRADDGLTKPWKGACWMNPPYGTSIGDWMTKAHESANAGATVVCLVPARTDTTWWWEHARFGEVRFLRGRLRFGEGATAPFPSAVVVMGTKPDVCWWEAWNGRNEE